MAIPTGLLESPYDMVIGWRQSGMVQETKLEAARPFMTYLWKLHCHLRILCRLLDAICVETIQRHEYQGCLTTWQGELPWRLVSTGMVSVLSLGIYNIKSK